mgnify:CR=1 FL=1
MTECHICELKNEPNNLIFETSRWVVMLNIDQNYLGRYLIISKQHVESLSSLSTDEWNELHDVAQKSENTMKKAFPEIAVFNWLCAMNHAFKEKPYRPHIHWHVFPRIEKPLKFEGITWTDTLFGKHYDAKSSNIIPEKTLQHILKHVKNQL